MAEIPTRNGLRLCSHRDPVKEAELWVNSIQGPSAGTWIVLGIGSGIHLNVLVERFPKDQFLFLDFDPQIKDFAPKFEGCQSEIIPTDFEAEEVFNTFLLPRLATGYRVLTFRPSWVGLNTCFNRLRDLLLGQPGECLSLLSSDSGLKKAFFGVPPGLGINIKSITEAEQESPTIRWRRLRALRELVT